MKKRLSVAVHCALTLAFTVLLLTSLSFGSDSPKSWDEKYADEPYVYLRLERIVEIRKDFTTLTTVRTVAKIQKEGGKELGEISVTYDQSMEEVKNIEAFVTTPQGEKLKHREIRELNPQKEYAFYSDERTKVLTMPNVVIGSVIEWQSTVETRKPVIERNFYDMVYLSSSTPVKLQKYTLIAPKDMVLHIKCTKLCLTPSVSHVGDNIIYSWETAENEKIEQEEYMPSWDEVADRITVTTLDSWETMSKWAFDLFRRNLRLSDDMKKKVQELVGEKTSQADKIQAIIKYIQEDFRYVYMSMDFHSYEPHPADDIFSNKYGDCKDHTLLGIAMLSAIGVKAYPVLFPAGPFFDREIMLPMPSYFNHAILSFDLEGKRYYCDLLRKGYQFHEIPDGMSGRKVFVLDESGGFADTIAKSDDEETLTTLNARTLIQEDGNALVEISGQLPRNWAVATREAFKNISSDEREKFFSSSESSMSDGGKIIEREWRNLDTPYTNITFRLKFENSHLVQRAGKMLIFGIPQRPRGSRFSMQRRKYPVVFMSDSTTHQQVNYTIPDDFEIVNLPKSIRIAYDFGSYERSYKAEGRIISVQETYTYRKSKTPAAEYDKIRNFYDEITKQTSDMIMIRKKG